MQPELSILFHLLGQLKEVLNRILWHYTLQKTIKYSQDQDIYDFSFGIIPMKRGIYCLTIIDIYQAMKKCDKISVSIVMTNNESHLYYLSEIYYGGGVIDATDLTHSYCFKVF